MKKTNKNSSFLFFATVVVFYCLSGFVFEVNGQMKLDAVSKSGGIEISWDGHGLGELESVIVLKKESRCPESIYDGQETYRGNGNNFYDKDVKNNESYCYALVVSDVLGNMSGILSTKQIEKQNAFSYYIETIKYNYIIIVGPVLIVVLWLIDRFTRRRDAEKMKKKEAMKVIRNL